MTQARMTVNKTQLAAFLLGAAVLSVGAQTGRMSGANQGYATDKFEGFEAVDNDERLPQKEKSMWYSVSEKTAEKQLAYAVSTPDAAPENPEPPFATVALATEARRPGFSSCPT